MKKTEQQIEALARKLAQDQARMRDLQQRQKAEDRRADARRKILYGAAFLSFAGQLPEEQRRKVLARVEAHIHREKDREFLELDNQ